MISDARVDRTELSYHADNNRIVIPANSTRETLNLIENPKTNNSGSDRG